MITETEITGAYARMLREERGLTQTEFWRPLGVKQSVACRYEHGLSIPRAVRILLVVRYVSGVMIDAGTVDGVEELTQLGSIQAGQSDAKAMADNLRANLSKTIKSLEAARDALRLL